MQCGCFHVKIDRLGDAEDLFSLYLHVQNPNKNKSSKTKKGVDIPKKNLLRLGYGMDKHRQKPAIPNRAFWPCANFIIIVTSKKKGETKKRKKISYALNPKQTTSPLQATTASDCASASPSPTAFSAALAPSPPPSPPPATNPFCAADTAEPAPAAAAFLALCFSAHSLLAALPLSAAAALAFRAASSFSRFEVSAASLAAAARA